MITVSDIRGRWGRRAAVGGAVAAMAGGIYGAGLLTADAATAPKVAIDFSNTRIQSVKVFARQDPQGSWVAKCVSRAPNAVVNDTGLEGGVLVINSYVEAGCHNQVHSDQVHWPGAPTPWVVSIQTLDDDDSSPWTQVNQPS